MEKNIKANIYPLNNWKWCTHRNEWSILEALSWLYFTSGRTSSFKFTSHFFGLIQPMGTCVAVQKYRLGYFRFSAGKWTINLWQFSCFSTVKGPMSLRGPFLVAHIRQYWEKNNPHRLNFDHLVFSRPRFFKTCTLMPHICISDLKSDPQFDFLTFFHHNWANLTLSWCKRSILSALKSVTLATHFVIGDNAVCRRLPQNGRHTFEFDGCKKSRMLSSPHRLQSFGQCGWNIVFVWNVFWTCLSIILAAFRD